MISHAGLVENAWTGTRDTGCGVGGNAGSNTEYFIMMANGLSQKALNWNILACTFKSLISVLYTLFDESPFPVSRLTSLFLYNNFFFRTSVISQVNCTKRSTVYFYATSS